MFEKNDTPFKIILYALFTLVLYLLQSVPALGIRFMDVSPELLLTLVIAVAFFENETFSAFFGLACGLLNDIRTGGVVGKSALFFMFCAFFISVLLQTLFRKMFLTYVAMTLVLTALFLILEYIFTVVFFKTPPISFSLMKIILPKFLFTGVLSYPVYYITKFLHKKTTRRDEE